MKTLKNLLLFGIFVVLSCNNISCSSDDDNNTSDSGIYINFNLEGNTIQITGDENVYVINTLDKGIIGDDIPNSHFIRLRVPLDVTTGIYNITGTVGDDFTATYSNGEFSTSNEFGHITITEVHADIIKGTFSFSGLFNGENMSISNGEFRVHNVQ